MKSQALLVLLAASSSLAQGTFQNLDFEEALLTIDPNQQPGLVSATDALPGWTVFWGTNQQANVLYAAIGHGGTLVDLLGENGFGLTDGLRSIEGSFSVMLQGGLLGGAALYPAPASIRQTGLIPVTAQSIQFKAMHDTSGILSLSLNGISVPYFPLFNGPNYTIYGGDVSAFANRTVELEFSVLRVPGRAYSNWLIDSIEFSSSAIPEPQVIALLALGASMVWRYRCR